MAFRLRSPAAAGVLAALAFPALAGTGSSVSEFIELKRTPPTFPCGVRGCPPPGPKCLAKPCKPGPIGWPPRLSL